MYNFTHFSNCTIRVPSLVYAAFWDSSQNCLGTQRIKRNLSEKF